MFTLWFYVCHGSKESTNRMTDFSFLFKLANSQNKARDHILLCFHCIINDTMTGNQPTDTVKNVTPEAVRQLHQQYHEEPADSSVLWGLLQQRLRPNRTWWGYRTLLDVVSLLWQLLQLVSCRWEDHCSHSTLKVFLFLKGIDAAKRDRSPLKLW